MKRGTDVSDHLTADALESLSAWKNRAEHAEHRVKELEQSQAPAAPAPTAASESTAELQRQVASLQAKLAEAAQSLATEKELHAEASAQLRASTVDQTRRNDELAIRRMYEDLTGFMVSEVSVYDTDRQLRRYDMVFTGPDYHGTAYHLSQISNFLLKSRSSTPARARGTVSCAMTLCTSRISTSSATRRSLNQNICQTTSWSKSDSNAALPLNSCRPCIEVSRRPKRRLNVELHGLAPRVC